MSKASDETDTRHTVRVRSPLDESQFIRSKLYRRDRSAFGKYKELVFHSFSWLKLVRYELLVTLVGPIPGALGLVLRRRLYPGLFEMAGKGAIFGRNLTLRHADRIKLGEEVVLDQNAVLDARGAGDKGIAIGNRVIVNRGAAIQAKVGSITIGDDCNIGSDVELLSQGDIVLGENVSLACKVIVAGGRYVVDDRGHPETKARFSEGAISIGSNARIGMGAIIQDGVTIGENAIVAPGSVVYEDVPPNGIVWGNPARLLRVRPGRPRPHSQRTGSAAVAADAPPDVRQAVTDYLEADLFIEFGPDGFSHGDSLLDSGVLDSLGLVRLQAWVKETFDIELELANLDPSDIDSVDKIVGCIDARTQ